MLTLILWINLKLKNVKEIRNMISAKSLAESIKKIISTSARSAAATIPAIIMLCSLAKRPGLSTIVSVMNIVQKFKEKGIPTEPLPSGEPNLYIQMTTAIVDEIYRALREDANIQGAGAPGAFTVIAKGANAGGDITAVGSNTTPFKLVGIIQ